MNFIYFLGNNSCVFHSHESDLKMLGLTVDDMRSINCQVIDIADDFTDRIGKIGLKDIV